jgi:bifunctional enzyme CysN/CysC
MAGAVTPGAQVLLRTRNALIPASISAVRHRLDVGTLSQEPAQSLAANDIGRVVVSCSRPVPVDRYQDNRDLGAFLLIDRLSNDTLAAGMVVEPLASSSDVFWQKFDVHRADREILKRQVPAIVWLTGQSGAGKSTLANEIELLLVARGVSTYVLDGDNVRHGLNRDLGYSDSERHENVRRLAEVARILADAGLIAIVAAISPFARDRDGARAIAGDIGFYEAFVDTPFDVCAARDPKGLYQRARAGKLKDLTGGSPYEPPPHPDLHLSGTGVARDEARKVFDLLVARGHVTAT